jgi:release factor glutamine methyltransferase
MHCSTKRMRYKEFIFEIFEQVYEPSEDTILFADNLDIKEGERVADVGAGSGILAILAAQKASSVLAIDVNSHAIKCAKQNAIFNKVADRMAFMQADLLTALKNQEKFNSILFNAPYLPSSEYESQSWIGKAWAGGANGRLVVDRFIPQASAHLLPSGRVLMLQSTLTGTQETIDAFGRCKLTARVKAEQRLPFFETINLIEAVRE